MADNTQTIGDLPALDGEITADDQLVLRRASDGNDYRVSRDQLLAHVTPGGLIPQMFAANQWRGVYYEPSNPDTLYSDIAGTTPVLNDGDPIGVIRDLSGNRNHQIAPGSSARATWTDGNLLSDGVDDQYMAQRTLPASDYFVAWIGSFTDPLVSNGGSFYRFLVPGGDPSNYSKSDLIEDYSYKSPGRNVLNRVNPNSKVIESEFYKSMDPSKLFVAWARRANGSGEAGLAAADKSLVVSGTPSFNQDMQLQLLEGPASTFLAGRLSAMCVVMASVDVNTRDLVLSNFADRIGVNYDPS